MASTTRPCRLPRCSTGRGRRICRSCWCPGRTTSFIASCISCGGSSAPTAHERLARRWAAQALRHAGSRERRRSRRRAVAAKVPALLDFAGLTGREAARINPLSGGMKRRLTLARALINDPQLLIMDEPTTGLDPQARHLIWERLRRLTQEGKTLILTTHFMEE